MSFGGGIGAREGPAAMLRREANMDVAGEILVREIGGGIAMEDTGGLKWFDNGAGGISDGGTIARLSTRIGSVCIDAD